MILEALKRVSNRDIIEEIAKTVDSIQKMKVQGNELLINGQKNGKDVNFALSGKTNDYKGFFDFFVKYKDKVNDMLRELQK